MAKIGSAMRGFAIQSEENMTDDVERVALLPCPFCGSEIIHIESWARSFKPPRLYHEWHHVEDNAEKCWARRWGKIVASANELPERQKETVERWNRRAALSAMPVAEPVAWMYDLYQLSINPSSKEYFQVGRTVSISKPPESAFMRNIVPLYSHPASPVSVTREAIAKQINGVAFRPRHVDGPFENETEREKWLRARYVALYKADAILSLLRGHK